MLRGNFTGTIGQGYVCESNGGGSDIISDFIVMGISVEPISRMCEHPLESGISRIDNKVQMPRKIRVQGYVAAGDKDTIKKLHAMWSNKKAEFYSVVNKDGTCYKNLIVTGLPNRGDSDKFDLLNYTIVFEEVLLAVKGGSYSAEDPGMQSGVYCGLVYGTSKSSSGE